MSCAAKHNTKILLAKFYKKNLETKSNEALNDYDSNTRGLDSIHLPPKDLELQQQWSE